MFDREQLMAHMNDAERMIATGGIVSATSVRGLLEGIRELDKERQFKATAIDLAWAVIDHDCPAYKILSQEVNR